MSWYNTDSLLQRLSTNKKTGRILNEASAVYKQAGIDSTHVSLLAFRVAYLEKKLIDGKQVHLKGIKKYKKKNLLTVVDYTRPGNMQRMITVDVPHRKVLYENLVAQGAGTGDNNNDKYYLPVYFSNDEGSECSSLGMTVGTRGTYPDNPCHLCKFTLSRKHDCVVVMEGLEKGINNNLLRRDVVVHTTGSLSFGTDSLRQLLKISDTLYRVVPESCECCLGKADGNVRGRSVYASQCGIEDNHGYLGQSNGCLVLPEESHIDQMSVLKNGSLIFIYSNVIFGETNYFKESPVIKKAVKQAGVSGKGRKKRR